MFRAGLIRKLANGLFAYLPLGWRSFRKVEQIIREEMDAIGSLEMRSSVVLPGEAWKETGRWDSMGEILLKFKNRLGGDFVISPTNEESFTAVVRDELSSYRQLPLSLYHINTKYRDEIRPRYGVMRGREFVMKDAYTYNANEESLDESYQDMGRAYTRIFKRCGLSTIPVKADSGAIGGDNSEEFMVESEIGDNTLILCEKGDYTANVDKAACKPDYTSLSLEEAAAAAAKTPPIKRVETPGIITIDQLCDFLSIDSKRLIKTLIYRAVNVELDLRGAPGCSQLERRRQAPDAPEVYPEAFFAILIRGDLEVNEVKLTALLRASEVALAPDYDVVRLTGAPVGFAGPVGFDKCPLIADQSVTAMIDGGTGALAEDVHLTHVAYGRDFKPWKVADVRVVKAGDQCPVCGGNLYEKKGNELGHIFKLGYKYSKAMKVTYLDEEGKTCIPLMGCYGIGLDRTLASVIEEHHDDAGIVWPMTVAPYQVIIIPVKYEGALKQAADQLDAALGQMGVEVLLDDRNERPGVKFNDADLIGIPYRVVVGGQELALSTPSVEIKRRGESEAHVCPIDTAAAFLADKIRGELAALNRQ
jgi:prolyl-tRNA synthetase